MVALILLLWLALMTTSDATEPQSGGASQLSAGSVAAAALRQELFNDLLAKATNELQEQIKLSLSGRGGSGAISGRKRRQTASKSGK